MWPFRRKRTEEGGVARKLVAGLIIGGAIGSIIGKNMMDKHAKNEEDDDVEDEQ